MSGGFGSLFGVRAPKAVADEDMGHHGNSFLLSGDPQGELPPYLAALDDHPSSLRDTSCAESALRGIGQASTGLASWANGVGSRCLNSRLAKPAVGGLLSITLGLTIAFAAFYGMETGCMDRRWNVGVELNPRKNSLLDVVIDSSGLSGWRFGGGVAIANGSVANTTLTLISGALSCALHDHVANKSYVLEADTPLALEYPFVNVNPGIANQLLAHSFNATSCSGVEIQASTAVVWQLAAQGMGINIFSKGSSNDEVRSSTNHTAHVSGVFGPWCSKGAFFEHAEAEINWLLPAKS